jgi:hypothetical protein
MRLPDRCLVIIVIALLAALPGCGKKLPEFGKVSGVVRVNGQPQRRLLVRFMPDPEKGNALPINATGKTDNEGRYTLHYAWQENEGEGAPVGWHRVVIEDTGLSGVQQGQAPPPPVISPIFAGPASTPLKKEVKAGEQTIDLEATK